MEKNIYLIYLFSYYNAVRHNDRGILVNVTYLQLFCFDQLPQAGVWVDVEVVH